VACAGDVWKSLDEDAYHGPFDRRTAVPVLLVGSRWDPATTYQEAVAAHRLLPNSRLLTSNNWGHTATGTSACATDAVSAYLINGTLPSEGTVCEGDDQPFD
jgi:pimeloyl-ACP methyl ester carboxylesterase